LVFIWERRQEGGCQVLGKIFLVGFYYCSKEPALGGLTKKLPRILSG